MKQTTHIRNLIFLWRENKKEQVDLTLNIEKMLKVTKAAYKNKTSWVRNQVALLIRKIRKERPYVIQDYSEAKAKYDSIEPIDLSKVKKGSYVVKISREQPVKGERWCEYYINQSGREGTYKVDEWMWEWGFWCLKSYRGEDVFGNRLNEASSRSFRFATKEEIEEFKNRQKEYKQKKKQIKILEQQISKLYKEL
jgi:hypothetical protein